MKNTGLTCVDPIFLDRTERSFAAHRCRSWRFDLPNRNIGRVNQLNQAIAVKTAFGWSVFGPHPAGGAVNCVQENLIQRDDNLLSTEIRTLWETDFKDITFEDPEAIPKEGWYALFLDMRLLLLDRELGRL